MILLHSVMQPEVAETLDMVLQGSKELPYWELALKGGWLMIPLFVLSVIAVYIFVERYIAIRNAMTPDRNFMEKIKDYIHDGKIQAALDYCDHTNTPVSRMVEKGLQRIGRPLADINSAIENVGSIEIAKLEKGTPVLGMVSGGAPMIGFLGTVTGMVRAFFDMASAGSNVDIQILSSGIYEALVTTVAGLIVGITGYFFYNIVVSRIAQVVHKLETTTTEFMDLLNEPVK